MIFRPWLVIGTDGARREPDRVRLAPTRAERVQRILDDYPGMTAPAPRAPVLRGFRAGLRLQSDAEQA